MPSPATSASRRRQLALLDAYDSRAPRYTSYPTAVQFGPQVGPREFGDWLAALEASAPLSVYVHIPFCRRLCWYCGCNTRVIHGREAISSYVALLAKEIAMAAARIDGRARVGAIHLGGGTPNILAPEDLKALFVALGQAFDISSGAEIAAELDPALLTADWARAAARWGLNRASLGVQDLSPEVQAAVNRPEPFEVVAAAAAALRGAGIEAINLDLMYGLPRQTVADVRATLDQVLTLRPSRIALFGYAHVPWMKPHQKLIDDAELPGATERLEQAEAAADRLTAAGFVRVGMDHFARPDDPLAEALAEGRLHRNFQGYTTDQAGALVGFGASAISRLPQGYAQNQPTELAWRTAIGEGRLATARGVAITADDRLRGAVIEALMCAMEVDLEALAARFGARASDLSQEREALARFAADGVVEIQDGIIRVTEFGRPFVRSVCAVFDAYLERGALRHAKVV